MWYSKKYCVCRSAVHLNNSKQDKVALVTIEAWFQNYTGTENLPHNERQIRKKKRKLSGKQKSISPDFTKHWTFWNSYSTVFKTTFCTNEIAMELCQFLSVSAHYLCNYLIPFSSQRSINYRADFVANKCPGAINYMAMFILLFVLRLPHANTSGCLASFWKPLKWKHS